MGFLGFGGRLGLLPMVARKTGIVSNELYNLDGIRCFEGPIFNCEENRGSKEEKKSSLKQNLDKCEEPELAGNTPPVMKHTLRCLHSRTSK